ncbi:hypothetical protein [Roseibium aquae]|nr:hypothetical protein [Roseibium aquae]
MSPRSARRLRLFILLDFILCGFAAVFLVPMPYGPTLGLFLVVFGLWVSRFIYFRLVPRPQRPPFPPHETGGDA